MKRCPTCGVRNLDSDTYCFNCDEPLSGGVAATALENPGLGVATAEVRTSRRELRRRAAAPATSPAGIPALFASNLLLKLFLLVVALGIFFLVSIVAIWVAYDNLGLALVDFGLGGLGFLVAMIYPDVRTGLRAGNRGWMVALGADIIFLGLTVFPVLYYLASKGYIAGMFDWLSHFYWTLAPVPLLGALAAYVASLFSHEPN